MTQPFAWERDENEPGESAPPAGQWTTLHDDRTGTVTETGPEGESSTRPYSQFEAVERAGQLLAIAAEEARTALEARIALAEAERDRQLADHDQALADAQDTIAAVTSGLADAQTRADQLGADMLTQDAKVEQAIADMSAAKTKLSTVSQEVASVTSRLTAAEDVAQQAKATAEGAAANLVALSGRTGRLVQTDAAPPGNTNDLWLDTSSGKLHSWDGSTWVPVTDPLLTQAAHTLNQVETLAGNAEAAALEAKRLAEAAQQAAGQSVAASQTEYAVGASESSAPTSGWSPDTPTRTPGAFIWMRTRISRADGTSEVSSPVLVTGNDGAPGPAGADGQTGPEGPAGADGTSVTIRGHVASASHLPTGLTDADLGAGWVADDTGHLHVWSESAWVDVGVIRGDPGPQGEAGEPGVSIIDVRPLYLRAATKPAQPSGVSPSAWSETEPAPQAETTLWRSERITYSTGQVSWTPVTEVIADRVASQAQAAALAAASQAEAAQATAQAAQAASQTAHDQASQASQNALQAVGIADSKGDILIQAEEPDQAMRRATTLWIDTTEEVNTPKRWDGSAWTAVVDQTARDAASAAAAAQQAADQAAEQAAAAKQDAAAAQAAALLAQDTADTADAKATTASGMVTVASADPTDADAVGKPDRAIWDVVGNVTLGDGSSEPQVLRRWALLAGQWQPTPIGRSFIGIDAIGRAQIAEAAIGTAEIADAAITNAKIGSLSVAKLTSTSSADFSLAVIRNLVASNAFLDELLAHRIVVAGDPTNQVGAITLEDGAVTTSKLYVTSDMWAKMIAVAGDATIGGDLIVGGSIDASKIRFDQAFGSQASLALANITRAYIRDANILNVAASKITTGRLGVGVEIVVGDPTRAHVRLTHDGLHLMADPDGRGVREVAQMGTASAAVWSVISPTARPDGEYPVLAQATSEGDLIAQNLAVAGDVTIQGESIRDLVTGAIPQPLGVFTTSKDQITSGKDWHNAGLLTVPMRLGHLYEIVVDGHLGPDTPANTRSAIALSYAYADTVSGMPDIPYVNSAQATRLATWGMSHDAHMNGAERDSFSFRYWLRGWGNRDNLRIAYAFNHWGNQYQLRLVKGSTMAVIDHGPATDITTGYEINTVTPGTQSGEQPETPAPVKQTYTRTWAASALRSWRGSSTTTAGLYQGSYDGIVRYSFMALPDMSELVGADIDKIEVWLRCQHVRWSAGVQASIGTSTASMPASPQTTGTYPELSTWKAGEGKWVTLARQIHKDRAKAGQLIGLALGENATSENNYMYFSYAASDVKIRVTYRK